MRIFLRAALAASFIGAGLSAASAAGVTEAWRATGFDLPESVTFDPATNAFYVSNLGKDPMSKDGNGFISKLSADGTVEALKWVEGLDAPKGTDIGGGKLYVADLGGIVEIDIATAKIAKVHPVEGAKFLNDVKVAPDGRVFVSDTFGNAIYVLDGGKTSLFVQDPVTLAGANGLTIVGDKLIVANVGDVSQGFEKIGPGSVKSVDLATKAITDFGSATGNFDGIEPDGEGGVTVTANPQGLLLDVKPGAAATEVGKLKPGAADHEAVPGLFVVPQMGDNAVVAYRPQ